MKVKLLSTCAGPDGVLHPGEHDLAERFARALVAGGYAELMGPAATVAPAPPAVEQAMSPAPETAAVRPLRRTVKKPSGL